MYPLDGDSICGNLSVELEFAAARLRPETDRSLCPVGAVAYAALEWDVAAHRSVGGLALVPVGRMARGEQRALRSCNLIPVAFHIRK